MADRTPNLRSSIYHSDTDGRWHGWVTMGTKEDGSLDRRHRTGVTQANLTRKVQALERQRDGGVLQIHRILSRALKVAWKRGKTGRNVAALIDAPVGEEIEIEPLTQREHARSSPPPRTGPAAFAGRSPWHSASARARPSACAGSTSTSTRAPSRSAGSSSGPATGTAAATQPRAPPAATAGPARRSAESTGTLTAARRTAASAATAAPR